MQPDEKPVNLKDRRSTGVIVGAALRGRPWFEVFYCEQRAATEGRPYKKYP